MAVNPDVRNFLYENPQYYEVAYPEPDEGTPRMCLRMFERYASAPPKSILDLGCGTGRDLDMLSRTCPECWGIDALPSMVEYARARRPHLHIEAGDLRAVRLGRTFDAILCMGSAFMYALTNEDVERALDTFAAHAHEGSIVIVDISNASAYLGGGVFKERIEREVRFPDFTATAIAHHTFDRRKQLLVRRRTWRVPGRPNVEDFCRYRLFFPAELEHLLAGKGFRVVKMFDNKEVEETDLSGARLYVAAVASPEAP